MIEISSISAKCGKNLLKIIREVLETESPLSEEWLLKRIACLFGREKATSYVTEQYGIWMKNCSQYGLIIRNKFLYRKDAGIPMLRVPEENDTHREIKFISTEELGQGLKELLKQNVLADKNGLFKLLVQQLGFCRMGDAILERLEAALKLIDNDIQRHGNNLSLK